MRYVLLAVFLCASQLGYAASCATGTVDYVTLDNSTTATCGSSMTWSGSASYTTTGAPAPNTYWATCTSSTYVYDGNGGLGTTGSAEFVFRVDDVSQVPFVSGANATGANSYRMMDLYIYSGALSFYNANPGMAGTIGSVSSGVTYWFGVNWSPTQTRFYLSTTSAANSTPSLTVGAMTYPGSFLGLWLGAQPQIGGTAAGNVHFAQYRQSTVERAYFPTIDGGPTATPTPNWTATTTPTVTPTPVACFTGLRLQQFGDSFQLGTSCDSAQVGTVGARATIIDDLEFVYNRPAQFVSSTGNYGGILLCNYTNAVSAQTTTVQKNNLPTQLLAGLTPPNSYNDVVLLGGGTAGEILGETTAIISANYNTMMDDITAQSPKILIVLINPAWNPSYSYATTYDAWVASLAYGKSKGYRVIGYNPEPTLGQNVSNVCPAPDSLHPTRQAQIIMGHEIAALINQFFGGGLSLSPYLQNPWNTWMAPLLKAWP